MGTEVGVGVRCNLYFIEKFKTKISEKKLKRFQGFTIIVKEGEGGTKQHIYI